MFWLKLCKSSWNCAWNLAFPLFISPVVWNMCENLHYESVFFKELHNQQEYYWPTIYRTGAAVVSTITSYSTHYLIGQNRGLSGLKSIWPVIITGDLLCVIFRLCCAISLKNIDRLNYRIQGHFSNYSNWSGSLARQSIPRYIIQTACWLVSRFQGILFKWLVGLSVNSKVYYSNGSLARQSIPRYIIQTARWLASRFQGILFKWLVRSSVDSKVYYSNGSRARKSIPRYIIHKAQWLVGSPVDSLVSLAKFLWLFWPCMWALVTHIKTYRNAFTFCKYTFLRRIRWFDKFSAVAIREENTLYNSPVVSHLLS